MVVLNTGCVNQNKEEAIQEFTENEKEKIVVPAIGYFWAKEDGRDIYYINNDKIWVYNKDDGETLQLMDDLSDIKDFEVYKGNIFELLWPEGDATQSRLCLYDKENGNIEEVYLIDSDVVAIYIYKNYIIAQVNVDLGNTKYIVLDISNPKMPMEVDLNDIDINKQKQVLLTDDNDEKILYKGTEILSVKDFQADMLKVWGWNEEKGYIAAITDGQETFYKFSLDNPKDMEKLDGNIVHLATFDDSILIKRDDGNVEIVSN